MSEAHLQVEMLAQAGRLLLEYNESTGAIHRALETTAAAVTGDRCDVRVSYRGVAVSLPGLGDARVAVRELRYNAALQARVHSVLDQVRRGDLDPDAALEQIRHLEASTPRHGRWVGVGLLGAAGASLAALLGADAGAVAVVGLATGLGLAARQELGRRHFNLLTLPLAAAFLGAALGGLAIRLGWTATPGLALVVPSLMLVPGPHLINGLLDWIDNYLPMCIARLWLATGILLASALGIVLAIEATLSGLIPTEPAASGYHLNLFSDMLLAGIVTCGFAVFYNAAWPQVGLAAVGGMVGHGLRFLALDWGATLEAATALGGFAVGLVSACIARSSRLPVAVIAFAGAVTMMPGLHIYRAIGGCLQLARGKGATTPAEMADTFGYGLQACFVVAALAVGLIVAVRLVAALSGEREHSAAPSGRPRLVESQPQPGGQLRTHAGPVKGRQGL